MVIKAMGGIMKSIKRTNIGKLIGSIAICHGAGAIGSLFTTPKIPTWYASLVKPTFTPPNEVFLPVWLTLYSLMGIAIYIVWRKGFNTEGAKVAFVLFWIQLGLNAIWSVVFFGFQSILGGVIIIITLWVLVLLTMARFFKISKVAGGLLVPYLVWLSIASSLNTGILVLNT